jgi:hypothetical protein
MILKYSSSFVINKIGNYIYDNKHENKNFFLNELENLFNLDSIFIPLGRTSINSISKSLNFIAYREIPNYRKKMLESNPIPKEHKENFKKWDWNKLIDLLSYPDLDKEKTKPDNNEKHKEGKLFKYLLRFFSHSKGNFAEQKWMYENFIYLKAGKLFIKNTITIPDNLFLVKNPPESQFECTISFMG